MTHIRLIAAVAGAAMLVFSLSPASARSCEDSDTACASGAAQASPMKLDQFMNTWKPVSVSKRSKRSKTSRHRAVEQVASKPEPAKSEPAKPEPAVAEALPLAQTIGAFAAIPEQTVETDGVAVTSFNEVNELDQAAGQIQVVAFNDINDIDLAASSPPAPAETVAQSASSEQAPADNSWIGKLLLAAAGTIAIAGATRLLVAA
jgi:hypothetical protein